MEQTGDYIYQLQYLSINIIFWPLNVHNIHCLYFCYIVICDSKFLCVIDNMREYQNKKELRVSEFGIWTFFIIYSQKSQTREMIMETPFSFFRGKIKLHVLLLLKWCCFWNIFVIPFKFEQKYYSILGEVRKGVIKVSSWDHAGGNI